MKMDGYREMTSEYINIDKLKGVKICRLTSTRKEFTDHQQLGFA